MNKSVSVFLLVILILVLSVFVSSFVLTVLWEWFIVPVFNVPDISLKTAYGMMLIFGMFKDRKSDKDNEKRDLTQAILDLVSIGFLYPVVVLIVGYIVYSL